MVTWWLMVKLRQAVLSWLSKKLRSAERATKLLLGAARIATSSSLLRCAQFLLPLSPPSPPLRKICHTWVTQGEMRRQAGSATQAAPPVACRSLPACHHSTRVTKGLPFLPKKMLACPHELAAILECVKYDFLYRFASRLVDTPQRESACINVLVTRPV